MPSCVAPPAASSAAVAFPCWILFTRPLFAPSGSGTPPHARLVLVHAPGARHHRVHRALREWSAGWARGPGRARQQHHRCRYRDPNRYSFHRHSPFAASAQLAHQEADQLLLGAEADGLAGGHQLDSSAEAASRALDGVELDHEGPVDLSAVPRRPATTARRAGWIAPSLVAWDSAEDAGSPSSSVRARLEGR